MFVESIAIIVVILLIFIIFLREHHTEYAKTAAILTILPISYALSYSISYIINKLFSVDSTYIIFYGILIGLILTCILIGCMAHTIKRKKLKIIYVTMNGLFALTLTIIMIVRMQFQILK